MRTAIAVTYCCSTILRTHQVEVLNIFLLSRYHVILNAMCKAVLLEMSRICALSATAKVVAIHGQTVKRLNDLTSFVIYIARAIANRPFVTPCTRPVAQAPFRIA